MTKHFTHTVTPLGVTIKHFIDHYQRWRFLIGECDVSRNKEICINFMEGNYVFQPSGVINTVELPRRNEKNTSLDMKPALFLV